MEDLELSGWWWLPDDEDKRVAGIMAFSNEEGIRLSLIGSFKELQQLGSTGEHPLILGIAGDGKRVTLFDCLESGSRVSFPGFLTQDFLARFGCTGAHFSTTEEARFHKATVEYGHLADWVGISGFHPEYDTEGGVLSKYELTYTFPDEVKAAITGGEVSVAYGFETGGDLLREANLRQLVSLRVDLKEDLTFDEWMSGFVSTFGNLLTLATTRPNAVTGLSVYSRDKIISTSKGDREIPIDLFYQQLPVREPQAKRLFPHDMLFTLHDVADDFGDIVRRWLRVANELDSVCSLFFGIRYLPRLYSQHKFLNMMQAAESFHRRRIRTRGLPRARHRERVKSILDQAPAEHRPWAEQILMYSNEPSLHDRMTDLVDATEEVVSPLVGDKKRFIRKVVDTRHYLTHYDRRLRARAASGAELYYLTQALSFMVEACLLRELGLAPERVRELFRRNQRYAQAVAHRQHLGGGVA